MPNPLRTNDVTLDLWFPTPVWFFDVEDHAEINAICIENIYRFRKEDPQGRSQSNQLGWQSRLISEKLDWFSPLQELFTEQAIQIAKRCGYKTDLEMGWWANINSQYAYNRLHVHGGSILSGAYYLQACENSGEMSFIDMRFLRQLAAVTNPNCELRHLHYDEVTYAPVVGRCFIFPSWLPHYVGQNAVKGDRISLSFNLR